MVECLVPDFRGDSSCIETVVDSGLDVFAHNVETVEHLTPFVRDRRANYRSTIQIHLKCTLPSFQSNLTVKRLQ